MARPIALRQAHAYWRLAAKATRAGNHAQAKQFHDTAERFHRQYLRDQEAAARRKALAATSITNRKSAPK